MPYFLSALIGFLFIFFPKKTILLVNKAAGSDPKDFKSAIFLQLLGFFLISNVLIHYFRN